MLIGDAIPIQIVTDSATTISSFTALGAAISAAITFAVNKVLGHIKAQAEARDVRDAKYAEIVEKMAVALTKAYDGLAKLDRIIEDSQHQNTQK